MPGALDLFVFVDALGWDLAREHRVLEDRCPFRRPLESVLGYSCACIPTILTGLRPEGHRHFAFFKFDPKRSPFRGLSWLDALPRALTGRGRVRGWLSRAVAAWLGYTGYFNLYNVPFGDLPLLDYAEKRDLYRPGGIASGAPTVFDELDARKIPYHVSDWRRPEAENVAALSDAIRRAGIRAAYLYLADLDAVLHRDGTGSPAGAQKIAGYGETLSRLTDLAGRHYRDVRLHVFSDHGMADVSAQEDVGERLAARGLRPGVDHLAVLDSTMARVWLLEPSAGPALRSALAEGPGRVLEGADLARWGCRFAGDEYGELIYLAPPGTLIFPNHMGARPVRGMHGYDPAAPASRACYLGSAPPRTPLAGLWDLKALMVEASTDGGGVA